MFSRGQKPTKKYTMTKMHLRNALINMVRHNVNTENVQCRCLGYMRSMIVKGQSRCVAATRV